MVNNTDHIIRVATYARVSTLEQADKGTSLDVQDAQLKTFCQSQGWVITNSYVDPGFSGKDGDRPGLNRLLSDAKFNLFDKVVVSKLDRMARNLRLLLSMESQLREYQVALTSVKESIDTSTSTGKMIFQMFGMIAEWEREAIIERTRSGRLQRYKEGCNGPGNRAYGYEYDKTTKKLVINEQEARVVRLIFQEYASGKSMMGVAHLLNSEKIPCRNPKGKGWQNGSVRDVIVDPIYKGTRIVNVYQKIKALPDKIPDTAIKIAVPPIVEESLWNTAQERRKNNKHLQPAKTRGWLLQGLVTCGSCGYSFRLGQTHYRRTYECRGRLRYTHLDDSPRCTIPNIDAKWLEAQVWQRIEAIINDPNKLKKLLEDTIASLKNREAELSERIKPINERLSVIAMQKERLAEEWVQANLNHEKWEELKADLEQEESRLQSVRGEIDPAQIEELEQIKDELSSRHELLNSMAWNTENEDGTMVRLVDKSHITVLSRIDSESKKREYIDKLQVRVIVFADRIEIKALFPIEPIKNQLLRPDCRSEQLTNIKNQDSLPGSM